MNRIRKFFGLLTQKGWSVPLAVAALTVFVILINCVQTPAREAPPVLEIQHYNLSYSSELYMMYAVAYDNIDPDTDSVKMLFWDEPRSDGYELGTQARIADVKSKTKINGRNYLVFYSKGLAPKQLTDTVYCRACVSVDSETYYSEPVKYSPIKYITDMTEAENAAAEDKDLVAALRNYGAAAQVRFDYHTERIATETFYDLTLIDAHLADLFAYGIYKEGTELTVAADVREGRRFVKWVDGEGQTLGNTPELNVVLDRDRTIRAVFDEIADFSTAEGLSFGAADRYQIPYFFIANPMTVEASIKLPASVTGRGGVLLGNYSYGSNTLNIEAYNNGKLRIYCAKGSSVADLVFDTDIRSEDIRHLTVTLPEQGGTCRLYIDGALVEEKEMPANIPAINDTLLVGGDYRKDNAQYFKGTVYSLAVFDGIRSDAQIAEDALFGANAESEDLLVSYVFDGEDALRDRGRNHKDILTEDRTGLSLENVSERYSLTKTFDSVPRTYEALIETSADVSNRKGCTIVGNYTSSYTAGITFRVYLNGSPSLCLRYDRDHQDQYTFPASVLKTGRVHIAITIDDTYVYGYLNGKQVLKKAHCGYLPELSEYPFSLGGDNRTDNTWWFRSGTIYSVNLFSEYRTAEQIEADIHGIDTNDPTLMLSYNFEESFEDRSAEQNNLVPYFYESEFIPSDEYDYTFACVGDTQSLVKKYPDRVHNIYDFIIDNLDQLKIRRVIGLGDMTEDNTADQWEIVSEQVFRLDDVVPYTVIRGNHDHYARTPEAEATKELMFGYYFDNEMYRKQFDDSFDGGPTNTFTRFTVNGIPYLLLCLDYGPDDDVLSWASDVVEQYPNDNVIVATHAFLFHDGTTLDATDICPPRNDVGFNNCDEMWDKFVSRHANIVLVLCGHDPSNEIVYAQMTGEHGNVVTCCLINPQHTDFYDRAAGLVALLHFKNGGSTIAVEYYSTVEGKFYKTDNVFEINNVAVIE